MAGDPAAALDHAVGRAVERLAAHQQRARAAGAAALRQVPGVALVDDDLLRLDAQLVGEELAVGGEVALAVRLRADPQLERSEEHTSELQSLMRISYAVFCLKKKQYKHKSLQRQ